MKRKTRLPLIIFAFGILIQSQLQKAYSQACTFVSPLVQVVASTDSTAPDASQWCVQTINLTVDINVNNGNKWTYIHVWRSQDWHTTSPTFNYNTAPTNSNILGNNLLTLALSYQNAPVLSSTYAPDGTENPQVQDAGDGITFVTSPSVNTPGATTFVFSGIKLVTPGACDPSLTYKGDSWSSQSANGGVVQCYLQGIVFATSDPTIAGDIVCAPSTQQNILNFSVTANGTSNQISFQFDVYSNTDPTTAFDPNTDTKIYTGTTTYTVIEGSATTTLNFTSSSTPPAGYISIPAMYPSPYSTVIPTKYQDLYVVLRNITITNGTTTTPISNSLVTALSNTCQALPVNFGSITASSKGGQLVVGWQSLTEENVKEYIVEASKDGVNWKEIGKLSSKALNGNSTNTLNYQLTVGLSIALSGLSLAMLLLIPTFKSRKLRIVMLIAVIGILAACAKNSSKETNISNDSSLFVRISQHDSNGAVTHSKIVKVTNE